MSFPTLPTHGQVYVLNKKTYTYDSNLATWFIDGTTSTDMSTIEFTLAFDGTVKYTIDIASRYYNEKWNLIRKIRDQRIAEFEWRYARYNRHARLGLDQIDDLTKLDNYTQLLANITDQESPDTIVWPVITDYTQD